VINTADVKWIKIVTDIFDDEKILLIEQMPDADTIIVIWFKLLCLAGKTNNGGVLMLSDKIPYTEEMLATIFRRPINTVRLALRVFEKYGMIEIIDNVITIPNWEKHQSIDQLEKIRTQTRLRVQKYRNKQKLLCNSTTGNVTVTFGNATDKEEDKDIDIDIERERRERRENTTDKPSAAESPKSEATPYEEIKNLYLSICVSFPRIQALSANRKKAIHARWVQYHDISTFKRLFDKAEASDFLKGKNKRNWSADFDWMLNDNNMAKILEGKYDNDKSAARHSLGSKPDISTPDAYNPPQDDGPLPF
jgi:predicted phage replisome organizer